MAYHGPVYGLSRECHLKAQAKFNLSRAQETIDWVEDIIERSILDPPCDHIEDTRHYAKVLKDGTILCELINKLRPGSVAKINTEKSPFKQRENIELFLKACSAYGLKSQSLFQVSDLYEERNLYMVVDCIFALGGLAQANHFNGPVLGVKVSKENKRNFSPEQLAESSKIIGLQYGSNKGASQAGMTAYGTGRQIIPDYIGNEAVSNGKINSY